MSISLNAQARKIWSEARIRVWDGTVVLATFPRFAGDRVAAFAGRIAVKDPAVFIAFVTEGEECSLTTSEAAFGSWRLRARATAVTKGLRAITIEASMPPDLVGFFAPLAERLAEGGIPIVPQCGFHTDHLLVPEVKLQAAVAVIERLISDSAKEIR